MTDFDPIKIIKTLASSDPKLLIMIASLPEINCDNFIFEKWKKQVKLSIKEQPDWYHYIIDFYDAYSADKCTKIRYVANKTYGMVDWGIFGANEHFSFGTKSMSKLIDTCKDKEIKELLNFI